MFNSTDMGLSYYILGFRLPHVWHSVIPLEGQAMCGGKHGGILFNEEFIEIIICLNKEYLTLSKD